jgi:hypothetical protein
LADRLSDHEVEEGGLAHFAVANQDHFVFIVVPLKQRLRWEVAIAIGSRNDDYKVQNFKSNLLDFIVDSRQIDRIGNHSLTLYLFLRLED